MGKPSNVGFGFSYYTFTCGEGVGETGHNASSILDCSSKEAIGDEATVPYETVSRPSRVIPI